MKVVVRRKDEKCHVILFKQKTAYEDRISDWSSDVCSSDLRRVVGTDARQWLDFGGRSEGGDGPRAQRTGIEGLPVDWKSVVSGKSVSVRVDLGGRRIIQTNTPTCNRHLTSNCPKLIINQSPQLSIPNSPLCNSDSRS